MPTLRPQKLSGLVVIPTVESEPGIHRVSIAINVGVSRTGAGIPAPEVVTREDLVVELKNASEGSLEAIGSPDPGPLPVRALRVVQARGEFTFAQGVNPPDELVVALRGDRKSFPMSQTLSPTRCLGKEPQVGDPFRVKPRTPSILDRLRKFLPLRRSQCCVKRFEAPLNSSTDATAKSESFEMEADFVARAPKCQCGCCEYRQFVRGTFTDAGGAAVRFDLPSGALDPAVYCEDGAIDEFGAGKHGYYGHRATSSSGDAYGGTGASKGCTYRANEKPSCPPTDGVHLEFLGLVVDVCRGRVAAKETWVVDL
ncbi:MAG: hypothetical protein M3340_03315 [Actinomycetota bacterium]|nr:hypothetical protein [Actinomycetota bacterium]